MTKGQLVLRCQWSLHTSSLLPRARAPLHIPLSRSCLTKDSGPRQRGDGGQWRIRGKNLAEEAEQVDLGASSPTYCAPGWGPEQISSLQNGVGRSLPPPKSIAPQNSASSPTRGALTGM